MKDEFLIGKVRVGLVLIILIVSGMGFFLIENNVMIADATKNITVGSGPIIPGSHYNTIQEAINFCQTDTSDTTYIIQVQATYNNNAEGHITINYNPQTTPYPRNLFILGNSQSYRNIFTKVTSSPLLDINFYQPGCQLEIQYFNFVTNHNGWGSTLYAINIANSLNVLIQFCNILKNTSPNVFVRGISVTSSQNIEASTISMTDVGLGFYLYGVNNPSTSAMGLNNNVISPVINFQEDMSGIGIYLEDCYSIQISDDQISNAIFAGIYISSSSNVKVESTDPNTYISANHYGIYSIDSTLIEIIDYKIYMYCYGGYSSIGICIKECTCIEYNKIIIQGVYIDGQYSSFYPIDDFKSYYGIEIEYSSYISIIGNIYITDFLNGIFIWSSNNVVVDCDQTSISFDESNNIINENIKNCLNGINVQESDGVGYNEITQIIIEINDFLTDCSYSGIAASGTYLCDISEVGISGTMSHTGIFYGMWVGNCNILSISDIDLIRLPHSDDIGIHLHDIHYLGDSTSLTIEKIRCVENSQNGYVKNPIKIDQAHNIWIKNIKFSQNEVRSGSIGININRPYNINIYSDTWGRTNGYDIIEKYEEGIKIDGSTVDENVVDICKIKLYMCGYGLKILNLGTESYTTYAVSYEGNYAITDISESLFDAIYIDKSELYIKNTKIYDWGEISESDEYYGIRNSRYCSVIGLPYKNAHLKIDNYFLMSDPDSTDEYIYIATTGGAYTYDYANVAAATGRHYEFNGYYWAACYET